MIGTNEELCAARISQGQAEHSSVCPICIDVLVEKDGRDQRRCGNCGNHFHFKCFENMRDRRCPMCRHMADRLQQPQPKFQPPQQVQRGLSDPSDVDIEYTVLVLNGPRQGQRLRVVVASGATVATVAEQVADSLADTSDHRSIYLNLDLDPFRVKVSVNGDNLKDASFKIPQEHRDNVEVTIDTRGRQYLLQKLRDSGHAPLAELFIGYGQQKLAGREGEGKLFCYTYRYAALLQQNLNVLIDVHVVRGSGGTGNEELAVELVEFFNDRLTLDPTALLEAFNKEFFL